MNTTQTAPVSISPRWDLITAITMVVLAISLPLEEMAYHASLTHPVLFVLRWAGYLIFALDFYRRLQRGEYAQGHRGRPWLFADILAALPIGPLLYWLTPSAPAGFLAAAHLLPMLRLARVYVLARAWQQANPSHAGIRRIFSTLVFIALTIHWIGCWQLAVYDQDESTPFHMRYLQGVYWTVTTMTTIGYGDITPDKEKARQLLFTMLIMAFGAGVFGFIIGNIATIMSNLDFARNQHLDKMQRINTFLRYNKIPPALHQQVHGYYSYLWQTRRGFDEAAVLSELPPAIRTQVEMHLRRDIVAKVPFFRGADARMIRALVAQLKPRIALPGELVIQKGDIGESMFFIANGSVDVMGADGQPVATLNDGNFFGEIALLERCPRGADVQATTYCDLYTLDKSALDHVVTQYPEFGRHIREMADARKRNR